jgi:ubiquinone/menaquinone biosynthesis C-methylase UbiE
MKKKEINKDNSKTSWGGVADWYDNYLEKNKDSYQEKVIAPNLHRLLDIKKGMKIVDLACGQGFFSRKFKDAGAVVTGVDISGELIAQAKKRGGGIEYFVSPAHKLSFIKNSSVEKVVIVLALQNIKEFNEVLQEVNRILTPGGKLIMVLNHPTFRIPKRSGWAFDPKSGVQYRRIDGYLSESKNSIVMHPGQAKSEETISYHRPLQDFFKAFQKSNFVVTRLEEWISHKKSESGPRQKAEDLARKEIPLFMMIEIKKV